MRGVIFLFFLVSLGSCVSGVQSPEPPPRVQSPVSHSDQIQQPGKEIPFRLRVIDEINDGAQLHIKAGVESKAAWSASDAVVALMAMREGEKSGTTYYPLTSILQSGVFSQSAEGTILPGKEVTFAISVPAKGVTDYQLELLWGQDAARFLAGDPKRQKGQLEIRELKIRPLQTECDFPPCDISYQVEGNLFNSGMVSVAEATLGIGFVWIRDGVTTSQSEMIPEVEEHVRLTKLGLLPGKLRPIRLVVDQSVPAHSGGSYRPVVRVLEVSVDRSNR